MFSEFLWLFKKSFNNILIVKQISNFYNFSKHSYISYLFTMFYMFTETFENFINFPKIFLKSFKILLNCLKF